MGKIYLYLARRDKSDVKVIGNLLSDRNLFATRLTEHLNVLGLPARERAELERVIHEHRIEWEPWIESAENYQALRESLHKVGILAPPSCNIPLINFSTLQLPRVAEVRMNKNKIMTRRMS